MWRWPRRKPLSLYRLACSTWLALRKMKPTEHYAMRRLAALVIAANFNTAVEVLGLDGIKEIVGLMSAHEERDVKGALTIIRSHLLANIPVSNTDTNT